MSASKTKTTSTATAKKNAKPKPKKREQFTSPDDKKLADRASAYYSGTPVSAYQLRKMRAFVNRLKTTVPEFLECTASQMRRFCLNEIAHRELPNATKKKITGEKFDRVYDKSWPQKTIAILYELHLEQQKIAKRKTKTATPTTDAPAS